MKLQYNATRWISTADLHIACAPPILFEARSRLDRDWAMMQAEWEEAGADNVDTALDLVGRSFVNVAQDDEQWPLATKENAMALRDAIEDNSPGEGDVFMCHLMIAFARNHYRFLAENSAASGRLLPPLNGTVTQNELKTAAAKAQ